MRDKRQENFIRTSIGFLSAILIHLLIVLLFFLSSSNIFMPPPKNNGKKITLDLTNFVPPPAAKPQPKPRPIIPQPPILQPQPKKQKEPIPQPTKKIVEEKRAFVAKKENRENNFTKKSTIVKKEKPKKKSIKKEKPKKKIVKREKIKQKRQKQKRVVKRDRVPKKVSHKSLPRQKSALGNALMSSGRSTSLQRSSSRDRKAVSRATRKIIQKLYGSEFDSYGSAQKRFIENNLAIIHKITQGTLIRNGYPEIAARTRQEGVNIVSFYLHPNGNISRLRLEQEMGYRALDQNTLQVIRIAYKEYPLPRKTTKIKFYVEYTIY